MVLWTPTHISTLLPAIIVMIAIAAVLRITLGKKDIKIRMIPFQVISCLIVLLEIGKQVMSLKNGYDLYHLPFHFCSLLIFLPFAMSFYRGKYESSVRCITTAAAAATFILTAIYPDLIYSAQNVREFTTDFFSFHTVAFHNVVMLLFMLIPALDLHQPAPKGEIKKIQLFILGYCAVAASMAHLLKTNFNNFYTCNIAPLETVRQIVAAVMGEAAAAILYVLIVTVLDVLFVSGAYCFYRLVYRLLNKKVKVS